MMNKPRIVIIGGKAISYNVDEFGENFEVVTVKELDEVKELHFNEIVRGCEQQPMPKQRRNKSDRKRNKRNRWQTKGKPQ